MTAGGSDTALVLPTVSRDTNSSRVTIFDLGTISGIWPRSAIVARSILLRATNKGRLSWRPLSFREGAAPPTQILAGHQTVPRSFSHNRIYRMRTLPFRVRGPVGYAGPARRFYSRTERALSFDPRPQKLKDFSVALSER